MGTLAFGYILPTTGRISDLYRLEACAAGRTTQKTGDDSSPVKKARDGTRTRGPHLGKVVLHH